jgi:hypothetical protein
VLSHLTLAGVGGSRHLRLRASSQSSEQRPAPVMNSSTWPPIIETFFQNWVCCCWRGPASAKSQ